jgi:hypothetical protein
VEQEEEKKTAILFMKNAPMKFSLHECGYIYSSRIQKRKLFLLNTIMELLFFINATFVFFFADYFIGVIIIIIIIITIIIIIIIMVLQSFLGPWPLFLFLDPTHSR